MADIDNEMTEELLNSDSDGVEMCLKCGFAEWRHNTKRHPCDRFLTVAEVTDSSERTLDPEGHKLAQGNIDRDDEQRHEIHMAMLAKSKNAKDLRDLTVVPLGFAVDVALQLLKERERKARADVYTIEKYIRDYFPEIFKDNKWYSIQFDFKWNPNNGIDLGEVKAQLTKDETE